MTYNFNLNLYKLISQAHISLRIFIKIVENVFPFHTKLWFLQNHYRTKKYIYRINIVTTLLVVLFYFYLLNFRKEKFSKIIYLFVFRYYRKSMKYLKHMIMNVVQVNNFIYFKSRLPKDNENFIHLSHYKAKNNGS